MAVDADVSGSTRAQVPASPRSPDSDRLLRIYLADHRAGAAAGQARARRFAAANADSVLADAARDVCQQIEEDVETLDEVLARLGRRASRWKVIVARGAELAGRLKPNGRLRGYSPLSRVLELELLVAGIVAKESLWQTLALVQRHRGELTGFDFDDLQHRARQQRTQLEAHRSATVNEAFLS
jgi:hypothetical protein